MAYPTLNFQPTSPFMGLQPIATASTTQAHTLGTVIRARDVNYGEGEFIYLTGVASTAAGDLVCFNSKTGATVRAVDGGSDSSGPCAIAMAATVASTYGWFQLSGSGPINAATAAANTEAFLSSTAGQVDDTGSSPIVGMQIKAATSAGFATVQLDRPSVNPGTSGLIAFSSVGSTPSAAAASVSGSTVTLQPTDLTHPGLVSLSAQTLGDGNKSFNAKLLPVSNTTQDMGDGSHRWGYAFMQGIKDSLVTRLDTQGGSQSSYTDGIGAPAGGSVAHRFNTSASYPTGSWLGLWYNSGTAKFGVSGLGSPRCEEYTDTSASPGDATANTASGRAAIAASSAAAITITCNVCSATAVVLAQVESADATCKAVSVVPGAGSFTVTPSAATTGITKFRWVVFNGN